MPARRPMMPLVEKIDPPAFTDHSFVSPLPPDLFLRLRVGLQAPGRRSTRGRSRTELVRQSPGLPGAHLGARRTLPALHRRSSSTPATCRSSWRCCRWSRVPSSPTRIRAPAPRDCGNSFRARASNYGLKQNWWYDGRRDVVASTRAALDYLQSLHDSLDGDWLLAIAAYNCGEGNVQRAINRNLRQGKPIDFWHLKLPTETRAYVPKLLAMRRIVANPAAYGLEFSQIDDEPYFTQVSTGGQIDLQVVAADRRHHQGRTVRTQPGLSSLGHRPDRSVQPAGADRCGRRAASRRS